MEVLVRRCTRVYIAVVLLFRYVRSPKRRHYGHIATHLGNKYIDDLLLELRPDETMSITQRLHQTTKDAIVVAYCDQASTKYTRYL